MSKGSLHPVFAEIVRPFAPPPVDLPVIAFPQPDKSRIARFLDRAEIGADYLAGRITDEQYIAAAVKSGLTRKQAVDRCLVLDDLRGRR